MKRFAISLFTTAFIWSGSIGIAADPVVPGPMAPTVPQIAAPVLVGGVPVPTGYDIRNTREPFSTEGYVQPCGPRKFCLPKLPSFSSLACLSPFKRKSDCVPQPYDPVHTRKSKGGMFCDDCTPAFRQPLPPLPDGMSVKGCASGHCGFGKPDGACWNRFKEWFCYRQTPIHLGYTPVPRTTPLYLWFPCNSTAGCGNGCGPAGCDSVGYAKSPAVPSSTAASAMPEAPLVRGRGSIIPSREVAGGCQPCPIPGEVVMPGYRLANPEKSSVVGKPIGQSPVAISSYKIPVTPAGPSTDSRR